MPNAVTGLPLSGGTLTGPLAITGAFPAGNAITVTNTSSGPSDASVVVIGQTAGDRGIGVRTTGDTFSRVLFGTDGSQKQSSGSGAADVVQTRPGAGIFAVSTGSMSVTTAGQGFRANEGANGKQGLTAAMTAGTITVANTSVTANSRIMLTSQATGGTVGGENVSTRTAATSFTITSTNAADTSTVAFQIFEPG